MAPPAPHRSTLGLIWILRVCKPINKNFLPPEKCSFVVPEAPLSRERSLDTIQLLALGTQRPLSLLFACTVFALFLEVIKVMMRICVIQVSRAGYCKAPKAHNIERLLRSDKHAVSATCRSSAGNEYSTSCTHSYMCSSQHGFQYNSNSIHRYCANTNLGSYPKANDTE